MTPGSKWRHYKGGFYKLLGCCRLEATGEPCAVYKEWGDGDDHGPWWCRPLAEWNEMVPVGTATNEPVKVRRFTEVAT